MGKPICFVTTAQPSQEEMGRRWWGETDVSLGHQLWAWAGAALSQWETSNCQDVPWERVKNRAALREGSMSFAVLCALAGSWITKPCFNLGASLGPWDVELWAVTGVLLKRVGIWLFMLSRGCFKEKWGKLVIHSQLPLGFQHLLEFLSLIYMLDFGKVRLLQITL